jgi:predicted metal-dependent TIM-barrel fold hydrolase
MRFIDGHLHTDMVEDAQLQKLVMMGMEAAVIPSPHMFLGNHDADTVLLLWERFLTMEVNTAATLGYQAFASLSVPFFGVNHADAEKCLARLPELLAHERVAAMGEIGLDCGTPFEVELFREQLRLAKAHDLPVILHTPIRLAPQGATVTPQIAAIIAEEKSPLSAACSTTPPRRPSGCVSPPAAWSASPSAGTRCRPSRPPATWSNTPSTESGS